MKFQKRKSPSFSIVSSSAEPSFIDARRFDRNTPVEGVDSHTHNFFEIVFFDRGTGWQQIGSTKVSVCAGSLLLISPGVVHQWGNVESAEGWIIVFSLRILEFAKSGSSVFWQRHPLLTPFLTLPADEPEAFIVPVAERAALTDQLAALTNELTHRQHAYLSAVTAHLVLLLIQLSRLLREKPLPPMHEPPLLVKVFTFIDQHYAQPVSLLDVARAINLTPGHLTTFVRQQTGRTVLQWITERRMGEARRLLLETDDSIETISAQVGYSDPAYFTRQFRRLHLNAPLFWREMQR